MNFARYFIKLLLIVSFLISSLAVFGNERSFKKITRKDGLSHSTVYSLVQDQQGVMWFGTGNGLNRFNGVEIKQFRHNPEDPESISNNSAGNLYIDKTGIIWIGTWGGGLNRLDPENLKIVRYVHDPDNPYSISGNKVQSMFRDSMGYLWVGTRSGGLNRFNAKKGVFKRYSHEPSNKNSISDNRVWSIVEDKSGFIWVGTDKGLNRFNPETEQFKNFIHDPNNPASLSHSRIRKLYVSNSGEIWVGTQLGFNLFNPETAKATRFYTYPKDIQNENGYNTINAITQDTSGTIWVGAANYGLMEFEPESGKFRQYLNNPNNNNSLSHNDIRYLYIDPSNNLWIGTRGGGINILDLKEKKFGAFYHNNNQQNSLSGQVVLSIIEDIDQDLWIGTQHSGLNLYSPKTQQFTHFKNDNKSPNGLKHNTIEHIIQDQKKRIWIATPVGLGKIDKKTGQITYFTQKNSGLTDNDIYSLFEDQTGMLWLGMARSGLVRFDPETNEIKFFKNDKENSESISDDYNVQVFLEDKNCLWVGTQHGLNCFNKTSRTFHQYYNEKGNKKSLSNNMILSVQQDHKGQLWIGTLDGLNLMINKSGTFLRFSRKHGLNSSTINGILENNGFLWLSTNKGISQMNIKTFEVRNFEYQDGLQSLEFIAKSYYKSKTGEMFFGSINGFNSLKTKKININTFPPPVILTDFKIFNQSVELQQPVSYLENLNLSHKDSFFSFEFVALDYTNPKTNQYAYKLEGFDANWIYTDSTRRHATYTNINGGDYTFKVKAVNNNGIWSEQNIAVNINVTDPFYKTWIAYSIYLFAIALTILLIIQNQRRKYNREIAGVHQKKEEIHKLNEELESHVKSRTTQLTEANVKLQQEVQIRKDTEDELINAKMLAEEANRAKSEFLANMSHELRTPMHSILSYSQFGIKKHQTVNRDKLLNYFQQTYKSGKQLLVLLNDLLDLSKLEAGKMTYQKKTQDIITTISECGSELDSILEDKKIALKIENPTEALAAHYDDARLKQVIRNLISNAIKFSFKGDTVFVTAEPNELYLEILDGNKILVPAIKISIKDMGIGIPKDELASVFDKFAQSSKTKTGAGGTGLGLAICLEIIREHRGNIWAENNVDKGSTFSFLIPRYEFHAE